MASLPQDFPADRAAPVVLSSSAARSHYSRQLIDGEKRLARLGRRILGQPCEMVVAAELEGVAVLPKGTPIEAFPLHKGVREHLFEESSYVKRVYREPRMEGHTDQTHEGRPGVQIEFVTRPFTAVHSRFLNIEQKHAASPILELAGARRVTPAELARILEILPKLTSAQASAYGLEKMDFSSVPFRGEMDQTSGLQANINLISSSGQNLFDRDSRASPLLLCFILEMVESEREATALFAPTPEAFKRFRAFAAPKYAGLGHKRITSATGSMLIRGPGYTSMRDLTAEERLKERRENPDVEEKLDRAGGTRLEHRAPNPEMLTVASDTLPYIWMRYYVTHLKRALVRYDKMRKNGTLAGLDEEAAFRIIDARDKNSPATPLNENALARSYDFPASWNEAVALFGNSARMEKVLGEDFKTVADLLQREAKKQITGPSLA